MKLAKDKSRLFMCMTLNFSKLTAFCKYSLAILPRLINSMGYYSVQLKRKKEKAHDFRAQGLASEAASPGALTEKIKAH